MTKIYSNLRLGICAREFDLIKWSLVGSDGKIDFECGD